MLTDQRVTPTLKLMPTQLTENFGKSRENFGKSRENFGQNPARILANPMKIWAKTRENPGPR